MRPRFILFVLLTLLAKTVALAQDGQYQFLHLDIHKGLSHNEVNCIFKDAKGFMWFGTMSGLNRYDGYKFKVFKHNLNDTTSLNDDYISNIFEGPGNKLWVQTRTGFNIYDPLTETFNRNVQPVLAAIGINDIAIKEIKKDKKGNYWFLSQQSGLYKYNEQTKKLIHYLNNRSNLSSPDASLITGFAENKRGDLWIIHANGVVELLNPQTDKVVSRVYPYSKPLAQAFEFRIYVDEQDDFWVFNNTSPAGVIYYDLASKKFLPINKDSGNIKLNSNIVLGLVQDGSGIIWIATDHGGVNLIDKKTFKIRYLLNNEDDSKSISQNSIITIFKDNTGIIWAGTFKKGISYYHENIIQFPLYKRHQADNRSLPYEDVNRFVEDSKGNIWIGTNGGGLLYFNRKAGTFTQYLHNANNPNSLSNDVIVGMHIDNEQKLWIGTYYGGLDCYDGNKFTHYRHNPNDPTSLSDDRVWDILEDSQGRLWVGTLSGGLDQLDRKTKTFKHFNPKVPNTVRSNYISSLLEDKQGNIWIGTSEGFDVLDKQTGKYFHYGYEERNQNSLSNNNVITFLKDSSGRVWVATREGLNVYDYKRNKLATLDIKNGLPGNTIVAILEDNNQHVWVSTPNGIAEITVSTNPQKELSFQIKSYDEQDGLQGRAFNERSALKTSKGELIFGGGNGFNLFNPASIKSTQNTAPIILTDLQVFNQSVLIGQKNNGSVLLKKAINETDEIVINHNQNVFSLEFAALNYTHPDKIRYEYKLEGFDKDWLIVDGDTRKATYTNLDAGDYVFKVRVISNDNVVNGKELTLNVKVLPPFWKSPLAYILYSLVFVGILFYSRKRSIEKLRSKFTLEQERQQAQRMHELDMMKIKFFTNVSHEFRTPLSLILAPLDKMLKQTDDKDQIVQLQLINRNAKRLLNMVNQLLDFRKMEVREHKLYPKRGNIIQLIKEISYSFTDMAEKKNIDFKFSSDIQSLVTDCDHEKLERILFNLLSNAFKFTPESGEISVRVNLIELDENSAIKTLEILVRDSGIGIEHDKQEQIFEQFFQNEVPGSIVNQGSGIGLAITKEFVKLHKGTISVESEPGEGSCFIVHLPLKLVDLQTVKSITEEDDEELAEEAEIKFEKGTKKTTLLLVEDNEDFRFYLKDNLKQHFNIIEASNGREGWQKALSQHPHLIVSDITMPEMNGIELCNKLKHDKRTSHIPIILLTALIGEDQLLKGLESGANDYMTKPFNFEVLLSKIKNLLQQQESLKKAFQKQIEVKPSEIQISSLDEKFIQHVLKVVEDNISNSEFSVEELSAGVNMSRVALYKKILTITGKTPIEFIKSIRLNRATQLLEKSQLTVSEIAYEVGFNNPKYFTKIFKAEFGIIPSAYASEKQKFEEESHL
ncbi:hybrid sensor histidine kinase/response regulator [Solitalea longa]|uniref:histidine kinase n=1 Tax=Solitalea longa TaxID=2079460 RepID=A0A2S5A4G0_9SPHI|nr:two-component regulator propeller domain-containing protein [Solitalea longa]POY37468.1 hybrid sensor histidine kinase/response regulator [Solitalea longa]